MTDWKQPEENFFVHEISCLFVFLRSSNVCLQVRSGHELVAVSEISLM